jgi:DNA-binding beta-propeller fold protein YncE
MCLVDTQSDTILYRIILDYHPSGFEFSPKDPSLLYVRHMNVSYKGVDVRATHEGYIQEVFLTTRSMGRRVKVGKDPINMLVSKDGKRAYVSCILSKGVWVLDLDIMEVIDIIDTGRLPHGSAFAQ